MYYFKVDKKSGFQSFDKNLLIIDSNDGIPFYFRPNENQNQKFNLPVGDYETQNKIYKLKKPIFYSLPKMKTRYNFQKYPTKLKIFFGYNPNKCTVDLDNHTILFDESFRNEPRFVIDFIKFHELGHFRYSGKGLQSEKDCDNFACLCMLIVGYNPSQIRTANEISLGNHLDANKRKRENLQYLKSFTK